MPPIPAPPPRAPLHWQPSALVAEDDPDLRRLIVGVLSREGFVVSEARDGRELIEIARSFAREDHDPPSLVISDVRMPGRDGLSALGELREALEGAVILVITAYPDEAVLAQARGVGAIGVLAKPFALADLRTAALSLVRG
jgi:two-component system response regulator (stage 0 sporulation protein F)